MRLAKRVPLLLSLVFFFLPSAWAGAIIINNHSFEDDILGVNAATFGSLTGWDITACATCGAYHGDFLHFPSGVPDGVNTAYIGGIGQVTGGIIRQVLSEDLAPDTVYTLTVYVGSRYDFGDNGFPAYTTQLWAGGALLAEDNNSQIPALGEFAKSTVSYSSSSVVSPGQALEIRLISAVGDNRQGQWDNVQLTASSPASIPEPGTLALLTTGAALLLTKWRSGERRKHQRPTLQA